MLEQVEGIMKAFDALTSNAQQQQFIDQLNEQFPQLNANVNNLREALTSLYNEMREGDEAVEKAREAFAEYESAIEQVTSRAQELQYAFAALGDPVFNAKQLSDIDRITNAFNRMNIDDQNKELERMRKLFPELTWEAGSFGEAMRAAFQQQDEMQKWVNTFQKFADDIGAALEDGIINALMGVDGAFSDLAKNLKQTFKRMLAQMIYDAMMNKVVLNVTSTIEKIGTTAVQSMFSGGSFNPMNLFNSSAAAASAVRASD
jgi:uncharacterized coiled-coil DUF342 family protein